MGRCKGCGKPLCAECSEQIFGDTAFVCSQACADYAAEQPDPEDLPDGPVARIFASLYTTILVAVIAGGIGGFLFAFRGTIAIDRIQHPPHYFGYTPYSSRYGDPRSSVFRIFYELGMTDWRPLFAIGALLGIAFAVLYLKWGRKATVVTFLVIYLVTQLWALWTS